MEGKRRKREEKIGEANCYSVATVALQGGAGRQHFVRSMWKFSVSVVSGDSENEERRHHCYTAAFEMVNEICGAERGAHHLQFSLKMLISCGQLSQKFPYIPPEYWTITVPSKSL